MRQNITKVVLIPAYKPDEKLIDLLKSLSDSEITTVVVNDGSGPEYDPVFRLAELTSKVICHVQYAMLATFILIMNSVVLDLYTMTGMPAQIAKILTELTLFIISLTVQRKVIFRKKELKGALS